MYMYIPKSYQILLVYIQRPELLWNLNICKYVAFLLCFFLNPDLSQEGLFRKSGHLLRQRAMRERLNAGETLCLHDNQEFSAHDCAALLKHFLAELPEPILTERNYNALMQAQGELAY